MRKPSEPALLGSPAASDPGPEAGSEELRQRLERARLMELALDAVPLGVVVVGADGRELLRNRAAAGLTDARHDQALVSHLLQQGIQEALRNGTASVTLELRGPSPRVVEVRVDAPGPDPDQVVAVLQDVSDRYRLDAVRRDFVANVSHELRTPIGALGALAEAIGEEADPEVMRRLARRIGGEAERVSHLVGDLLDLSRVEGTGRQQAERVPVAELVSEALNRVRAGAEERGIELRGEWPPDEEMSADVAQMISALSNLLDNAIKYSEPGSAVDVVAEVAGSHAEFTVRDSGVGIPSRDHERIFERFYRVDRARSRITGGTGLGLAIVRHVALNHGGGVTVNSREGEGSEFRLRVRRWE
jgi:two-component system sensor histidine kinase SenX3